MIVDDLIVYGKSYCHSDLVKILLSELLNLNPLELLNHLNDYVEQEKAELFKREIKSIKEGKPIQYVLGHVNFYGNKFIINKNVLIPRFETEELVENVIQFIENNFEENIKILDIGCGSGVIGLTLKQKFPKANVDLLDISEEALEVAQENAKRLNLDVNFIKSDVFQNIYDKYDIIVSNPPYIKQEEEIEEIVKNNEPHIALYAGIDGLDIYKKILSNISKYVEEKFLIAFEIGCTQKQDIISLTNMYLKDITVESKKDLSEKDRILLIYKKSE